MRSPSSSRGAPSRPVYAGKVTSGKVKSLSRGQASGMISAPGGDVFFHKATSKANTWILQVGDRVVFELLNNTISGKRAQNVRKAPTRKARQLTPRVHLINPSHVSFGVAVITPRWLYVLAAATGTEWGDPVIVDETLEPST